MRQRLSRRERYLLDTCNIDPRFRFGLHLPRGERPSDGPRHGRWRRLPTTAADDDAVALAALKRARRAAKLARDMNRATAGRLAAK